MTTDMFRMYLITIFSAFMTYHQVYKKSSTTGATCGAGIASPSGAPEFTPYISGVRIAFFLLVIGLSVLVRFTASGYPVVAKEIINTQE